MPVIIVEDGSGSDPLANSYVTEQELQDYAQDRGVTISEDASVLLIKSMDYSRSLDFIGVKSSQQQPLQWPRRGVRIDGYTIPGGMIPGALKIAQLSTALSISGGRDPLSPIPPSVKSERVADIEVVYQDGASSGDIDVALQKAWSKLVIGSGGGNQMRVVRA